MDDGKVNVISLQTVTELDATALTGALPPGPGGGHGRGRGR
ncbi:hypothetical protein OHA25_42175 [Nonomuraea sp. NBC_00507]